MGLKQVKFIDWFQKQFPQAARVVPNYEGANFDSVFIDVNCILHPSIRKAKNEAMFVKKLFTILDRLLSQFIPDRICYLSVDGPAPLAKLLTQKARRAAKGSQKQSNCMSTLQVTPGCPFMSRLEQYLSYYTVRYLQQRRSQGISPDLKFVIDHSNNPGEGESKIIENIVQQASNIRGRPCAIISMDSDAVLQAIALGMPNIYVIRKDSPFDPAVVVSIDRFMRALEEIFPGESNRSRLDFCALCLFRGNDYLRGLSVGLERLWRAYLYTRHVDPLIQARGPLRFLIDAEFKTFDLYFLRQLILHSFKSNDGLRLPADMEEHRSRQHEKYKKQKQENKQKQQPKDTARTPVASTDEEPQYENESDMESVVDENEEHMTDSVSESDGEDVAPVEDAESEDDDSNRYSIKQFLQGVLWNLEMYCSGKCPDVSFSYDHRTAPPRRAIVAYVDTAAQAKVNHRLLPSFTNKLVGVIKSDKKFLHPLVCALILLPAESGAAYLPQSIAPIHTEIVPGDSKHLTQDEMEDIDAKVQGLIDILGASHQPHDKRIAQELSALYTTRAPYIWTRARFVNSRSRPGVMPLSPTTIIERLAASSTADATGPTSGPRGGGFLDLPFQSDILCHMVKVPPNVVHGTSNSPSQLSKGGLAHAHAVPWVADFHQLHITESMKTPSARWPFYNVKSGRFRNSRNDSTQANPPWRQPRQPQPYPEQQPPQQGLEQQQLPLQSGGGRKQADSRHGKGRHILGRREAPAKASSDMDLSETPLDQKASEKNTRIGSSTPRQSRKRVPKSGGNISGLLAAVDISDKTASMVAAEQQ
ncbi:hypothetical protein BGZ70_005773 [Mortierella alpina]|uniref:Xrn1 N-terminal domain-containing protein n=1 Tax=Mortierella alpina TaxID=64518 RepID=A0A9P6JE32_MORAP|nr:hypothetical protein BGZ70_005773 [Mortierella alpina]